MFFDIVIDSGSISSLFIQIFKGLLIAVLLLAVIGPFFISGTNFVQGYKEKGYQYLITGCMLIGSFTLLFCILYYGFNINLLEVFLS